jgi:hypothetical protein
MTNYHGTRPVLNICFPPNVPPFLMFTLFKLLKISFSSYKGKIKKTLKERNLLQVFSRAFYPYLNFKIRSLFRIESGSRISFEYGSGTGSATLITPLYKKLRFSVRRSHLAKIYHCLRKLSRFLCLIFSDCISGCLHWLNAASQKIKSYRSINKR